MKVRVKEKSVINGESYLKGDVIDVTEDVYKDREEVLDPLTDIEQQPEDSSSKVLVAGLTRNQTILKLRELGVTVSPKIGDKKLAERFLETVKGE